LPDLDQDISATEIRAALAGGAAPQTVLAPAVAEYIRSHGLYRAEASS
jgi:nicotinic acid mononucleotide adenylyltransferase